MEFRLGQRLISTPSPGVDFSSPRRISFAAQVPTLGLNGVDRLAKPVRLRRVDDEAAESYVQAYGARREGPFWVVDRRDPFPFDLGEHLPRMARRSVVPDVPSMMPDFSWFSSIARMVQEDSWNRVVADAWRSERVCHDCGSVPFRPARLEGWEQWSQHEPSSRRLDAIRILCPACLETRDMGLARREGRFDRVFARLMVLNRIDPRQEGGHYLAAIEAARPVASSSSVRIDLSALAGAVLHMREGITSPAPGRLIDRGSAGTVELGREAHVSEDRGRVVVRIAGRD